MKYGQAEIKAKASRRTPSGCWPRSRTSASDVLLVFISIHRWLHSKRTPKYRRSSRTPKSRHTGMPSTQTSPQRRWPYGNGARGSATNTTQVADDNGKRRLHRERPSQPRRGKRGRKKLGRRTDRRNASRRMARSWAKPDAERRVTGWSPGTGSCVENAGRRRV